MRRIGTPAGLKASAARRRKWREEKTVSKHAWGRFVAKGAKAKRKKRAAMAKKTRRRNRRHGG